MTATAAPLALTLKDAADLTPFSVDTIERAVKATDPKKFPPPLRAKRDSRGRRIVLLKDLEAWLDSLPDA
ncbi:hypothetical protein ACFT5B_11810 [Luteimicrobium sp. NPDC057192]|uniref:hypothetical protein n=1 Tax=Luteimicrobium sp. NPDC057192 TaxID=3346042 RepID=UPI0036352E4A